MSAAEPPILRLRESPLKAAAEWTIEDGDLVRRGGRGEARWPLRALTRFTLGRRPNRYGPDLLILQLRFGRRAVGFGSQGWAGLARPVDDSLAFGAFVRALAAEAAHRAPQARFEAAGGLAVGAGLWWIGGLLALGVVAMLAMAVSTGLPAMGLELSARLLFALLLMAAALPWLPGRRPRRLDPLSLPPDLAPGT